MLLLSLGWSLGLTSCGKNYGMCPGIKKQCLLLTFALQTLYFLSLQRLSSALAIPPPYTEKNSHGQKANCGAFPKPNNLKI